MPVTHRFPSSFEALVLQNQREKQNKSLYHDVRIVERPVPALKPGEILVNFNHRGASETLPFPFLGFLELYRAL